MFNLFRRILSLKAEKSRSMGWRLRIRPLYFFCLSVSSCHNERGALGTSKIPIGERGDVPLLVPVRHKPVLSSLHLRVVMACTTSATSCQGCTHSDKILGHERQQARVVAYLPNFLIPKSWRMMRAQVVVATLGVRHQARLHQSVHHSSADQNHPQSQSPTYSRTDLRRGTIVKAWALGVRPRDIKIFSLH